MNFLKKIIITVVTLLAIMSLSVLLTGCPPKLTEGVTEKTTEGKETRRIAFHSDRDGNLEIYVVNADGSEQTNLTNNKADDFRLI